MLVAAAGPASNLLLAAVAAVIWRVLVGGAVERRRAGVSSGRCCIRVLLINVLLAVFNMIPMPPLDGGNVLAGLLPLALAGSIDRLRP